MKANEMALHKDFGIIKYVRGNEGEYYYLVKHIVSGEVKLSFDIKTAKQQLEMLNDEMTETRAMIDQLVKRGYKVYKEITEEITLD
jgi:hypothetical protein